MSTLLHLDASPRAERSISRALTRDFAESWKKSHPSETVIYRDLSQYPIPFVDESWIGAAFTPPDAQTAEGAKALALSDTLIAELEKADHYVFGIPMYNLSVPAVFKAYIDQVVRVGKTFRHSDVGYEGLLKGKKGTLIVSSGAVFRKDTPLAAYDLQQPWLRTVLAFMGVTEVEFIVADGVTELVSRGKMDQESYLKPLRTEARQRAALV